MISDVLEKSGKQAHIEGQHYDYKETREKDIQNLKLMVVPFKKYICMHNTDQRYTPSYFYLIDGLSSLN